MGFVIHDCNHLGGRGIIRRRISSRPVFSYIGKFEAQLHETKDGTKKMIWNIKLEEREKSEKGSSEHLWSAHVGVSYWVSCLICGEWVVLL